MRSLEMNKLLVKKLRRENFRGEINPPGMRVLKEFQILKCFIGQIIIKLYFADVDIE